MNQHAVEVQPFPVNRLPDAVREGTDVWFDGDPLKVLRTECHGDPTDSEPFTPKTKILEPCSLGAIKGIHPGRPCIHDQWSNIGQLRKSEKTHPVGSKKG